MVAIFSFVGIPFITLLPVFASEVLGKGPEGFGFLVGATGVGALSAALFLAFRGDVTGKYRYISLSAALFSVLLLFFSLSKNYLLSLVLLVGIGWALVSLLATANSFIQLSVPDNLRGRAMSVFTFVFLGTAPIGNAILGILADGIGTTHAVTVASILCICAAIMFLLLKSYDESK